MEWINVKDRFPPIEERVLVFQKGGVFGGNEVDITYRTHEYYEDEKEINNKIAWHDQGISNNIHFWMPLPQPPNNNFYYECLELNESEDIFSIKYTTKNKEEAQNWVNLKPHFRTWHEKEEGNK